MLTIYYSIVDLTHKNHMYQARSYNLNVSRESHKTKRNKHGIPLETGETAWQKEISIEHR